MCDSYAAITSDEPQVWLFHDNDCRGGSRMIPVGITNNLDVRDNPSSPPSNAASSMVIPPHMDVQVTTHPWYTSMTSPYAGHTTTFNPDQGRIYRDLGQARASSNAGTGGAVFYRGWNDDIDGMNVTRRQSWDSWKDQCCKNQKDDGVCPEGFRHPNDSNCYNYMNGYCSAGANMWDGLCAQWGPVESKKQEYCNTGPHFAEKRCKEWCTRRNPDGTVNFGKCDAGARLYCGPDGDPNDPICACINSKVTKYNPACVDAPCATGGYLTSTQSALQCPTIVDCSIVLDLQSKGTTVVGDIQQNCSAETNSNTGPQNTQTASSDEITRINKMMIIMFIILVFIVILAIILGVFYLRGSAKNNV